MKIYNFYQGRLYQVIRENPYKLADDIDGVGFRIADEIASKAGILPDLIFVSGVESCMCLNRQQDRDTHVFRWIS